MNEAVNNTEPKVKPKKKRSWWWLKLLLVLIILAAGVAGGMLLSTQAIGQELINEAVDEFDIPVSTPMQPVPVQIVTDEAEAAQEEDQSKIFVPVIAEATPAPEVTPTPKPSYGPKAAAKQEARAKAELEAAAAEETEEVEAAAETVVEDKGEAEAEADVAAEVKAEEPVEAEETEIMAPMVLPAEHIGIDEALETALEHAKASEYSADVFGVYPIGMYGIVCYRVDFEYNDKEYIYDVNAATGEIEGWRVKGWGRMNNMAAAVAASAEESPAPAVEEEAAPAAKEEAAPTPVNTKLINQDEALATALFYAGDYSEEDVVNLKTGLEFDDGVLCYEIEFRADKYKFEVKIDATTGMVVDFEKEK